MEVDLKRHEPKIPTGWTYSIGCIILGVFTLILREKHSLIFGGVWIAGGMIVALEEILGLRGVEYRRRRTISVVLAVLVAFCYIFALVSGRG